MPHLLLWLPSLIRTTARLRYSIPFTWALFFGIAIVPRATAALITPQLTSFGLTNTSADGTVVISNDGLSFVLTGGNTGSDSTGFTDFTTVAQSTGLVQFQYSYSSLDTPGFDNAGYRLNNVLFQLADTDGTSGIASFSISAGQAYGWWVDTLDNIGEPGILAVSFSPAIAPVPEPGGFALAAIGLAIGAVTQRRLVRRLDLQGKNVWRNRHCAALAIALSMNVSLLAQQNHYTASSVTGQLILTRTVNALQAARPLLAPLSRSAPVAASPEISKLPSQFPHPALSAQTRSALTPPAQTVQSLPVISGSGSFGFPGLAHYDQRLANSGNQFSVEPPNPSIAVANGFIVEGVNNAFRVYTTAGTALLPTISSNQLFGLAPAIDRNTGINGVFPTDMRVFFDHDINRWFVLQRSQDNDIDGNPLDQSHIYLAVSQTTDPVGTYNIYVMDTSNVQNPVCPCLPDYPQIGSDQYGFYISANEYNTSSLQFADATILAISKTALATGATAPATYRFTLPRQNGFEFSIQPAGAPPGASQFLGNGGLEYFVSSQSSISVDSNLSIWALSNTASLQSANPSLLLTQTTVPTLRYTYPNVARQRPGPLPYGSTLSPPGALAFLDGGIDSRVLSVSYAGGRLFLTFATQVTDEIGNSLVGGGYVILSPTFRSGVLAASVLKQGYLAATNSHVLRPAIAVNAQGRGAIAFTLVGTDHYPSAAFVSIDTISGPSAIQIAGAGVLPEDGFTGYPGGFAPGLARWGDYSTAVTGTDGTIWMVSEYIPNDANRTKLANWGTFVSQYIPR